MLCFSLSYLQLENFVLPPIGTSAAVHRPTKLSSLNTIVQQQQQEQPQQSVSSIKALNDEKTTPKTAAAAAVTTTIVAAPAAFQQYAEPNTMSNNTADLRVQNGNES